MSSQPDRARGGEKIYTVKPKKSSRNSKQLDFMMCQISLKLKEFEFSNLTSGADHL